jgi:hypothetical protein
MELKRFPFKVPMPAPPDTTRGEQVRWMVQNFGLPNVGPQRRWIVYNRQCYFKDESDAVLYRMTWL